MVEWFVSSAVLAALLIGAHYLLRGKISARLQYALWLVLLVRLLLHFLPPQFASSLLCSLLLGFLELTSGTLSLPASRAGFLACAAMLGWGGMSVHCQTLSALAASPLTARYYYKGKALQALLSVLFALPALPFLFP